jgi:hypothetical protein
MFLELDYGTKIFTAVSHAYTRDDKKNCKPLGKMCLAGGLNRHDVDTHRQTSN